MMRSLHVLSISIFLIAACTKDDNNKTSSCTPGFSIPCACAGGAVGAQVCAADGSSWGTCNCGQSGDGGLPGDGGLASDTSSSTSLKAPRIINLSVNSTTVTPSKPLTVTAIVTDPQGIDDLIGGKLMHPGGGTYGAFATSSQEGSYSIKLTWDDIHNTSAINATPAGITRVFRATFYDVAGHESSKDVEVTLKCDDQNTSCDGKCFDLQTSAEHCGKCGFNCSTLIKDTFADSCVKGTCELILLYKNTQDSQSCTNTCKDLGHGCDEASMGRANLSTKKIDYYTVPCSKTFGQLKQDYSLVVNHYCYCKELRAAP